jgi:diguanylate cyclase (GGDEF)-like protein
VLAEALEEAGLEVQPAATLDSALVLSAERSVDVLVVDLHLPGGGGLALLQLLRGHPRGALLVVVVAPASERGERVRALQLGAEDVLSDDLDIEEQVARIERVLRTKSRLDRLTSEGAVLRQLAVTDGLTGLNNHRCFHERLIEEFRRADRYGEPLSLVLLDLDHFKALNDHFGHPSGDSVLRQVGELLQRSVRDTDLLARYGGEEFAVLLPKAPPEGALTVAERIWRDLDEVRVEGVKSALVTASLGVATHPFPPFASPADLLGAADRTLYEAKRLGRNRVVQYRASPLAAAAGNL